MTTEAVGKIAVVIPAYQAEAHIESVLRTLPSFVAHVVVVDDASPDDTSAAAQRVAATDPRIHVVRHEQNQGVGGAVLTGYRRALDLGAELIVKVDSDGQMEPQHMDLLLEPLIGGEADYVKGNRFYHLGDLKSMPATRRIGNLALSFLTKLASGYWGVFDPTNGYTAIHGDLVGRLDQSRIDRRYFFETSMLLELSLLRAVVVDVPIPAKYGSEASYLSRMNCAWTFPGRLINGLLRRIWLQHFVRDFGLASLYLLAGTALLVFGCSFGLYHWFHSYRLGALTDTGTVMVAVLPVILGVQFLLHALALDVQSVPCRPIRRRFRRLLVNSHSQQSRESGLA